MRFKRSFKRPDRADPFAVFAQTYGIRTPRDSPTPKAEPDQPEPIAVRLMRTLGVFAQTYGIRTPRDSPPPKAERDESQPEPIEVHLMWAYAILGVPVGAPRQEISRAYKKLALMHHPDRAAVMGDGARKRSEERMKLINAAYAELRQREASL